MYDAYMIRNDGKLIPCETHPYFKEGDVYRTIETGEWLVDNLEGDQPLMAFINLLAWYVKFYLDYSGDEASSFLKKNIRTSMNPLSESFVDEHAKEIDAAYQSVSDDYLKYFHDLNTLLSQKFLRERYGGLYNTTPGNRNVYFGVSSNGFNWHPIIWNFVNSNKHRIDSVTIVRDESSTGDHEKYYSGPAGTYKFMSTEEFLTEKGNPTIELKKYISPVKRCLLEGGSLLDFKDLPINFASALDDYKMISNRESTDPKFWYKEDLAISRILEGEDVRKVLGFID